VIEQRLSELAMFKETHPILGTRDIQRAIAFYTQQLGFKLAFGDKADPPNYGGFRRDSVELHMQFQFEQEMGTIRLRVLLQVFTPFPVLTWLGNVGNRGATRFKSSTRRFGNGVRHGRQSDSNPSPKAIFEITGKNTGKMADRA
jgi:catechol 2,3-dioxygenase-like lactoylglutathione lyase family enzyme